MPGYSCAALVAMLLLAQVASALPARAAQPTEIAVSGTGTVTLPPDEATVSASIVTNDETNSGAAMSGTRRRTSASLPPSSRSASPARTSRSRRIT